MLYWHNPKFAAKYCKNNRKKPFISLKHIVLFRAPNMLKFRHFGQFDGSENSFFFIIRPYVVRGLEKLQESNSKQEWSENGGELRRFTRTNDWIFLKTHKMWYNRNPIFTLKDTISFVPSLAKTLEKKKINKIKRKLVKFWNKTLSAKGYLKKKLK